MSFYRGGAHKRRDTIEPDLLQAAHAIGARSWQLHGTGLPDLLLFHRGRYFVVEVKSSRGHLTDAQRDVPWPIIRSVSELFAVLGVQVA